MEYILHLKFIALHTAITTHNEVFLYASTLLTCNSNNWYFHHDRIHGTNANGLLHLQMLILIGQKHEYNSSIDWSIVALKISLEVKRFNGEIFDVKISFDLTPVPKTWANFRFFPSLRSFLSRFKRWLSPIERYTMIGFEWHSFELCRRYTKCHSNRNLFRLIQIKMIECHTHKCVCITNAHYKQSASSEARKSNRICMHWNSVLLDSNYRIYFECSTDGKTKITSNSIFKARHCDCDYVNGKCSHRHMNCIIFGKPIHKQVNKIIVIIVWSEAKWLNIMSKACINYITNDMNSGACACFRVLHTEPIIWGRCHCHSHRHRHQRSKINTSGYFPSHSPSH